MSDNFDRYRWEMAQAINRASIYASHGIFGQILYDPEAAYNAYCYSMMMQAQITQESKR